MVVATWFCHNLPTLSWLSLISFIMAWSGLTCLKFFKVTTCIMPLSIVMTCRSSNSTLAQFYSSSMTWNNIICEGGELFHVCVYCCMCASTPYTCASPHRWHCWEECLVEFFSELLMMQNLFPISDLLDSNVAWPSPSGTIQQCWSCSYLSSLCCTWSNPPNAIGNSPPLARYRCFWTSVALEPQS